MDDHEVYLHSGEDEQGAFYLHKLSAAWLPWFVLGKMADAKTLLTLGQDARKVWPAVKVIPMGWLSPAGSCNTWRCGSAALRRMKFP